MKSYEIYNFIICLIVFVSLTALFSFLIGKLIMLMLRIIRSGLDDEKIKAEYLKRQNKKPSRISKVLDISFSALICVVLGVMLCFSMYLKFTENGKAKNIPIVKVVETGSMESRHPANKYLIENSLNNQVGMFDLIVLHELPPEDELELYDIVVYESNGYFILHRIVGIEEPNETHPNEKWFLLQGDANRVADDFPVTYSQMRSIYLNERIPFIGSFVFFMQSPAGILCFLLTLFALISAPIAEKKIEEAKKERIKLLFPKSQE